MRAPLSPKVRHDVTFLRQAGNFKILTLGNELFDDDLFFDEFGLKNWVLNDKKIKFL